MAVFASTPVEFIKGVYATRDERVERARESFGRPLTLEVGVWRRQWALGGRRRAPSSRSRRWPDL